MEVSEAIEIMGTQSIKVVIPNIAHPKALKLLLEARTTIQTTPACAWMSMEPPLSSDLLPIKDITNIMP